MTTRQVLRFLLLLLLLTSGATQPPTKLLPGVTYYDGPEKLTGKLSFLLQHDIRPGTNADSSASIYEFDLSSKSLRKVTDSPKGLFIPSFHGDVYCVVYRPGDWFRTQDTNAFIYSESLGLSRTLNLEGEPQLVAIAGDHVFFELRGYNFATPDHYLTKGGTEGETKLMDFNIGRNQTRPVEFSDASRWQYCHYDRIHVPRGQTNVLHFCYGGSGKRVGSGKDYRDGYYSLDTRTGDIRWLAELLDDEDDDRYTFKASDGRYIFFEGPDGSGSPVIGLKLLSSPWSYRETRYRHAKDSEVKVLKTFSKLAAFARGYYLLNTISPDGRFALVRFQEATVPKLMEQSGVGEDILAVDLTNGKLRMLFKDDVEHVTSTAPCQECGGLKVHDDTGFNICCSP